jgi:8-oxo-dGTP pyrophosphatase MutT (NUDIX family)
MSQAGPASDPHAPYVRVALVGLIRRAGEDGGAGGEPVAGADSDAGADAGEARWLLLHRTQPFEAWDPPGGRMEAGEDLVQAVKREVEEESGLAVEVAGPCYAFLTFYKKERLLAVSMACRPSGNPDAVRLEPDGAEGWRWATGQEWEDLAAARLSSWDPKDVKKATRAAAAVWEAEEA